MIEEFNEAIEVYHKKWHDMVNGRKDKHFFEALKPTSLGWKVQDRGEYDKISAELHDQSDMVIEKWMNGRWIAKFHLRDLELSCGIEIIKLMERRPESTDAVGLDHLDFYSPAVKDGEAILKQEPNLKWSWEYNDVNDDYKWLSLWFDGTEAKLKYDTVLDIIQVELQEINEHITSKS